MEFDTGLYAVGNVPSLGIPSYVRLDTRLGWRPSDNLKMSLGFLNVLDDRHPEFESFSYHASSEVQHSVYGRVTYKF